MDSWTLQGDSYSFLRTAPRTFSLCHRDGTPNHVEIFDIINVPNQSSAISETTCLCDIFGDDCEPPSLSSSPAGVPLVLPQRELEGTAAATSQVDDLNDSSGSYHTAHGSSEGEEGFEDSRERLHSPTLQSDSSQKTQTEGTGLNSGLPEVSVDSKPNLKPKSKSPIPQLSAVTPSSDTLTTGERTPSPGHNSSFTLSPVGRASSSSSPSVEKRCSTSQYNPRQVYSEDELSRISPSLKDNHNNPLYQCLTSSSSPLPRNCVNLFSESSNPQSFAEVKVAQVSPEPQISYFSQNRSPLSEPFECTLKDYSPDFSESGFKSCGTVSSPLPSFSGTELSPLSRDLSAQSSEREGSYSPDTEASSPFPELRRRISLPDLFSRGSTPDREASSQTPELIPNSPTAGRYRTTTPESQDTRLLTEPISTVPTSAPRYTPPSPIISTATFPGLVQSSVSSGVINTASSPCLIGTISPAKTGSRSPSPGPSHRIRHLSTPSEIETKVSSPVISYSLSPSPEVTHNCSPIELRCTGPSPEIKITAFSPEFSRRDWSSEVKSTSASPLPESYFDSASLRNLTSSPHITGISYSVIQPEDRDSPPFAELQRLSTPKPDRTLVSSEARTPTPTTDSLLNSIAEPTATPEDSPHISDFSSSALQPEVTHQPKYQTYSPKPKHSTPSPEARIQTPSPDKYQSLSPRVTPVAPSSELEYHQLSPDNLSTVNNHQSHYKQPTSLLNNIPDIGENSSSVDIKEIVYTTHLEKESVSPSFAFDCGQKSVAVENKSHSPVVAIHSPESVSPFFAEGKIDSSLKHQSSEREETPPLSEVKQSISQEEETYNLSIGIRSDSPNLIIPQGGTPNLSVVHSAASKSPLQGLEAPQPKFTTHTLNSESVSSFKSACKPEHTRKQISTCVKRENKLRFTEDMAHHEYRRRTPSPPLTRFTPVHILPPEKPYRQWKNRNCSPSQAVASSNSGNLKNVVTNKESSNVAAIDNNSQALWVGLGMELEMEKQMQLEEDREVVRERLNDREVDRERKREEQVHEKGKGWQGDASYREEQAELSFIARNRKGPVTRRTAPTSREIRQGLPTVQSYSESLLATRRQQQYSQLASQQDPRSVGPSRRIRPSTLQSKKTTPGRVPCVASNRPGRSSSSSMGSELDEADNEVKWLTDLAFSSLSSPEVDYLDMYNSSHRSSTNISQPSTQDSPAGVNAAGLAYADFGGSAQKVDNDELSFQEPCTYFSDGLDPLRRNELGSFECVDVAVEREDSRKVRRGVPKRQIQLKRKNNAEGQQDESSENSSPGVPVMAESPSLESNSSETCMRKNITPAPMQDCYPSECNPEPNQQNERKPKLQKSVSLDESCSKTKMATCLIKSVLSKKMQSFDKQEDELAGEEVSPSFDENRQPTEIVESSLKESPKPSLSSSLQSDFSISSEFLSVKGEPKTKDEAKTTTSIGEISSIRPCSSSSSRSLIFSQSESEDADSECRSATSRSENKSEMKVPFNSKHSRTAVLNDSKTWGENESGELANATARNPVASSVTRDTSMQARMTNRGPECDNTEDHKQLQQGDKGAYTSNTQAITLKAMEKKKASLNVCLTPEADDRPGSSPDQLFQKKEERKKDSVDDKVEEEEENDSNQVKVPIHKVRDVRRLVKNTYNLSFKATGPIMSSTANEENMDRVKEEMMEKVESEVKRREDREEEFRLERKMEQKEEVKDPTLSFPPQRRRNPLSRPQPMQIEYRAVCSKDEKNKISCNKKDSQDSLDDKSLASPKLPIDLSMESSNANTQNYTSRDTAIVIPCQDNQNMVSVRQETVTIMDKLSANEDKPVRTDRKPPMLGSLPRQPSKEREVSTAVVLIRDGSSKTKASASSTQKEISTKSQAPAASPSPGNATPSNTPGTGGHSVSMLLKEKGYQADIGAVVGDKESTPVSKGVPRKHVNCLEIPLQATDPGQIHYHRERTFSASSNMSCPSAVSENADTLTKTKEDEGVSIKPTVKDAAKQKSASLLLSMHEQTQPLTKQKELGDFEAVKRLDPTFPPRSPAIRRVRPHTIEVNSLSKDTHKQDLSTNPTGQNRSQPIEVKSIAKSSQKPIVPPKPSCKFKPVDFGAMPNDPQRSSATTSNVKQQGEERSQTIVVSSPTIYRKISNESTLTSHSTRKLAVSAVSCIKPPPCKTMATTITNISNQSSASSETDASTDRSQLPSAPLQSSSNTEKATTLVAQTSSTDPGLTSEPEGVSDPHANQVPAPVSAGGNQPSQPAVMDQDIQPQHPRTAHTHEQAMPVASSNTKQQTPISTPQVPGYTHQTFRRSLSSERSQRTEDMHFYASDDPPSYDDRESFSPLMLPDLTTRRSNRYQPFTRPPPCSCTTGCPSHPGLTPPHHHRSPHNLTPPAPTHSPGQALPYPVAQPPLRSHQCRPDPQTMTYQPGSPKSCPLVPSQPPVMYQPLHHPPPCPPHPSLMHACPVERTLQPSQHIDPRRAPVHRSPQQQPPGMAAAPYSDPVHGHSPDLPPMDPQYLCGPQSLGPSYGSEYGGDSSSLYSENSYGQAPRRVLLDPETGKYFYIEVPVQPLRKMLFDPETGQYVEVLIPQQAMSHSGLYPPSAAPYPSLPNPNMYAPAPQYMPYAAPPPPAHPQTELQPPRYPEPSAAATMHPGGSGVSYRNPSAQGSKPEPQNHPPLDQSYLESMYYVPTGMNASPNTTPPDYYHKHLSNLPPMGGKRS